MQSKYVSKQFIDNTSNDERTLDAYLINNVRFNYILKTNFIKNIDLFFTINNILNTQYETNAWVYRYYSANKHEVMDGYFPQAGRNIMAGLNLKFLTIYILLE